MNAERSRPIFSRFYSRLAPSMDRAGMREFRRRLLEGLGGEVVEVGAGAGLSFAWYPEQVTRVLAFEPEPHLREKARVAAEAAPVAVTVAAGTAERLPCADESVDAVVCSLMLCSVDDQREALREARRVLRPAGELRFLEHVRAESAQMRHIQSALSAGVWPFLFGGCHPDRDTLTAIERAGFRVARVERFRFPPNRMPVPTAPHIVGIAVRA